MKEILRSPITWIIVSICVIITILFFCGFRITYAPELENSWDAISACASWAGVVASAIAIFVAIGIPKKIATQQNKISLFDKRYNAFNTFAFLTSTVEQIVNGNIVISNKMMFLDNMVETYKSVSIIRELASDCNMNSDVYVRLIFEAGKVQYLFDVKEMDIIVDFLIATNEYISDAYKGKTIDEINLRTKYNELKIKNLQEQLDEQLRLCKK